MPEVTVFRTTSSRSGPALGRASLCGLDDHSRLGSRPRPGTRKGETHPGTAPRSPLCLPHGCAPQGCSSSRMNRGRFEGAVPMRTTSTECRCKSCGALLAKRDRDGVSIRRGELQATITGDFTVSVTCYRCRTLNVVT